MAERRWKDREWYVGDEYGNLYPTVTQGVFLATLMDIRDELKELNALLNCPNFTGIPRTLRLISGKVGRIPVPKKKPAARRARPSVRSTRGTGGNSSGRRRR